MDEQAIWTLVSILLWVVFSIIALLIYLLPAIIAFSRRHRYKWPIAIVSVVLGGMVIPWVGALVWACMPRGQFTD